MNNGLEYLFPLEGVYYEVIAFPCGHVYSMPLGVVRTGSTLTFRVFRGAGLLSRLGSGGPLMLLSPLTPEAFLWSLNHELESMITWDPEKRCPVPSPKWGAWVECLAESTGWEGEVRRYVCRDSRHLSGSPPSYTRSLGCLVEMLIIITKLEADAPLPEIRGGVMGYLEWLAWCVSRSSGGRLDAVARGLLERASRLA